MTAVCSRSDRSANDLGVVSSAAGASGVSVDTGGAFFRWLRRLAQVGWWLVQVAQPAGYERDFTHTRTRSARICTRRPVERRYPSVSRSTHQTPGMGHSDRPFL